MKRKGWTLAELSTIIIVILILTKAAMSVVKNIHINQSRIFIYAAIRNLTMGSIAIKDKYGELYPEEAVVANANASNLNEWFCSNIADSFSLKDTANCAKTTKGTSTVNFVLANGASVRGMTNDWVTAYDDLQYKDIMVDVDSTSGMNKVGIDQFPLRIYKGTNSNDHGVDALILPVDCGSKDKMTNNAGNLVTLPAHKYCGSSSSNMASSSEVISYTTYRVSDPALPDKAFVQVAGKSSVESDCIAHGSKGFYGKKVCASYDIHQKCAHEDICKGCGTDGNCPNASSEANCGVLAAGNQITLEDGTLKGYRCLTLITKPTGGLGILGGSVIGDYGI